MKIFRLLLAFVFCTTVVVNLFWSSSVHAISQTPKVDFARDIQPILTATCNRCHGAIKAAAQLRLDVKTLAMKGGLGGTIIIPGNSKDSRLMKRILGEGNEARMPLGGETLRPEQIELVRRWIDEGANWPDTTSGLRPQTADLPKHWAYVKPVQAPLPEVKHKAWLRNPLDAFVLARLEKEGLQPAREAAKEMLLRRVYLDLIGIPPTIKEMDEFLADASPDAYEKVVDRLLASPHYGERWARPWLDLARYADSNGYEKDSLRVMWKYRDWVINALNADKPFDQFTIEQLAGDMLPNASTEQLIATGFHRNTLLNQEGGVDAEEAYFEVLVDRVNTTATVWLGSTMGCAQCHNHKYDPFAQKDYYRMMAFFDNVDRSTHSRGSDGGEIIEPRLELPTPEQEARRKALGEEIAKLETKLKTQTPALNAAQTLWEKETLAASANWTTLDPLKAQSTGGSVLTRQADKSLLASGAAPEFDEYVILTKLPAGRTTALRLEAMPDPSLPRGGPGRDFYGNFILSTIEANANNQPLPFNDGGWDDGLSRIEKKSFFNYEMTQISDRPRGWLINAMEDEKRMGRQAVFVFEKPVVSATPLEITVRLKFMAGGMCQNIGRLRLSATTVTEPLRIVSVPAKLKLAMAIPATQRTDKQREQLASQFRNTTPLLKKERDRLKELRDAQEQLGIVTALTLRERNSFERPSTYLRERGGFMNKGEKVFAGIPASLHAWPDNAPINRLGLAQWLVDQNNPLTARVAVNRFWEQFFGRGLVETSEDFGSQGATPSHPELLDWLAVEFMQQQQWSVKKLHRLIVTSATYRQDSSVSSMLNEKDPYNRLFARGPRFRLEAEMIRDLSLTASGLLSRKIGGPSVMPPQPEGIWRNPYSGAKWMTSKGEDRYRRGIYTFLRRTSPYPAMMTFDATSREVCTVRRVRTNTPLQSLTTLNDEAAMEMARALAKRMFAESSDEVTKRLSYGFRLCLTRKPTDAELARLSQLYTQQLAHYRANPNAAEQLMKGEAKELPAAELAAWTIVANVLLNLDETLTKQ